MATNLDHDPSEDRVPRNGAIVPALEGLRDSITVVCPAHAIISFRFDGKLHVDIDTRRIEEAAMVNWRSSRLQGSSSTTFVAARHPVHFFTG
jgi:hypothetical protein